MKKDIFLEFGCKSKNITQVVCQIENLLNNKFIITDGDYAGMRYHYSNDQVDELIVAPNYNSEADYWRLGKHKEYPIIISAAFLKGKNVDKTTKPDSLKKILGKVAGLEELDSSVIES